MPMKQPWYIIFNGVIHWDSKYAASSEAGALKLWESSEPRTAVHFPGDSKRAVPEKGAYKVVDLSGHVVGKVGTLADAVLLHEKHRNTTRIDHDGVRFKSRYGVETDIDVEPVNGGFKASGLHVSKWYHATGSTRQAAIAGVKKAIEAADRNVHITKARDRG